jgi:hypothetical protein
LVIAVGEYQAAVNRRKSPRTEGVPLDLFSRVVPDDDVLAVPSSGAQDPWAGDLEGMGGERTLTAAPSLGPSGERFAAS